MRKLTLGREAEFWLGGASGSPGPVQSSICASSNAAISPIELRTFLAAKVIVSARFAIAGVLLVITVTREQKCGLASANVPPNATRTSSIGGYV